METTNKFVKLDQFARFLDDCTESFITYNEAETSVTEAKESAIAAANSATKAENSATLAETYSTGVKEYANAAKVSAESAETFATAAETYSKQAETSKVAAAASEANVKASETAAKAAKEAAETAKDAAAVHETNTRASEKSAKASEVNAEAAAAKAAASAAAAKEEVDGIKEYADKAKDSADAAAESETKAKASETAAKTSETNAKASETAAKTSETNAATSETNANTSEVNAAASAKKAAEEVAKLAKAMRYKGSVATYSALPAADNEIGDVWNVQKADKTHGVKAGENVVWNGEAWDNLGGTCDMSEYAKEADQQKDVISASVSNDTVTLTARDGTNTALKVDNVANATKATQDAAGNVITATYAKTADLATVATSGSYNDLTDTPEIGGDTDALFFGDSYTSKITKISNWTNGIGANTALYFPNVTDIGDNALQNYYSNGGTLHFSINHRAAIQALSGYPKFGNTTDFSFIWDIDAVKITIDRGTANTIVIDGVQIDGTETYIRKSTDTAVVASDGTGVITDTVNSAVDFSYTIGAIPATGSRAGINIVGATETEAATASVKYSASGVLLSTQTGATTGLYYADGQAVSIDALAYIVTNDTLKQYSAAVSSMTNVNLTDFVNVPNYIKKTTGEYEIIDANKLGQETAYDHNTTIASVYSEDATTIGSMAFMNCSALTSLELPSVTTIGKYAFMNCSALTSLELPSATTLNKSAFEFWSMQDSGTVARTVHFAAANETTIKALEGYNSKFGYSGTISFLFDL